MRAIFMSVELNVHDRRGEHPTGGECRGTTASLVSVTPNAWHELLLGLQRVSVIFVVLLLASGCDRNSGRRTSDDAAKNRRVQGNARGVENSADQQEQRAGNYLSKARRMFEIGDLDSAGEAAYQALVQDPDSSDATLIASQVEAARGNHQTSADLAGSIDIHSRLGKRAVELRYQLLLRLGRPSEAADVMLSAVEVMPEVPMWRHEAWRILNRLGRREEASTQADVLCRDGTITQQELFSLLRRNDSFPFSLEGEKPEKFFERGLGLARWYVTQGELHRGLEELSQEYEAGFPTPAAGALYGRLLAETQAQEDLPAWHAKCPSRVREHGDYWSALGTFFFDEHQFEASAKAFLEAIVRDPTDDDTAHRLGKVFDALGRPEDAELFRRRAVALAHTKRSTERLIRSPGNLTIRKELMQKVLTLSRPFEVLQWSLSMPPGDAVSHRRAIEIKRAALLRDKVSVTMSVESSLVGVDPTDFNMEPAIERLRQLSPLRAEIKTTQVEQLAVPRLVNVAGEVGLEFQWYQDAEINLASIPIHEIIGGGIAVTDYDLDGSPDIYLAQGSGDPPTDQCTRSNVLFRNNGGTFAAVTSLALADDFNYSTGIAAGDVNQDGFPDLYLGSLGRNRLLINNGDGTFRDATRQLGDVADRFTTVLAIADVNGDALPDLFEANYVEMEGGFKLPDVGADGREITPSPSQFYAQADRWFENRGNGSFQVREISEEVALAGTSFGLIVTDFDSDGTNDVFVANDARPNHLLLQTGNNRFRNVADAVGVANGFTGEANGCMGIATGDFNRDGTIDLHITNFWNEPSNHYLQTTEGVFTDFAARYGINTLSFPYVGFGTKAVDIDRNGWLDLIVANGHVFDKREAGEGFQMPPQLFMNRGSLFEQVTVDDDSGYWDNAYLGRSIALTDFDRDGAIEAAVGSVSSVWGRFVRQHHCAGVLACHREYALARRLAGRAFGLPYLRWKGHLTGRVDGRSVVEEAVLECGIRRRIALEGQSGGHSALDDEDSFGGGLEIPRNGERLRVVDRWAHNEAVEERAVQVVDGIAL
jgi:tetratricopeptide (TPR) repeat protein